MYLKKAYRAGLACAALLCALILPGASLPGAASVEPASLPTGGAATPPDGFQCYAQREGLRLSAEAATGTILLEDTQDGRTWLSNPREYRKDPVARGANRTRLGAQLWLSYIDEDQKIAEANSVSDCDPETGGLRLEAVEHGLRTTYRFDDAQITLAVEYRLEDGRLQVSVPFDAIEERGGHILTGVTLLPNFGAAGAADSGYFILPDGCGALLRFNNGKYTAEDIQLAVYGADAVYAPASGTLDILPATLPMFAAVYADGGGYMAVAEQSAAGAKLRASTGGKTSSYNTASFTFAYRAAEEVVFLDRTNAATSVYMAAPVTNQGTAFRVDYYPLHGEEAGIAGVARRYRSLLETKGFRRQTDLGFAVNLDVYGGVEKRKTFLGIPYTAYEPLTTWDDLGHMLDDFTALGCGASVTLRNWNSNGAVRGRIDSGWKPAGSLGSRAQFEALAGRPDVRLYPFVELNAYQKSGNGVWRLFDSVVAVNRKRLTRYSYSMVTGEKRLNEQGGVLLCPEKVLSVGRRVKEAFADNGVGRIALSGVGNLLYTDLGGEQTGIVRMQEQTTALLAEMSASLGCMLVRPNAYAIPYAEEVCGLPVRSNAFDMADESIPFIQMVYQGYLRHYNVPLNLCSDSQKALLFYIESGSLPAFALMQDDYDTIAHTDLSHIYAGAYTQVRDACLRQTEELRAALDGLEDAAVRDYRILESGVRKIVYETGDVILVNGTDREITAEGQAVPTCSYVRYTEGEADG